MDERETNDAALVERARGGDAAAFDTLVRRHYRAGYAVALAILGRRADAEDACQEAWMRALARLESCREPERFAYWWLQIARNTARNLREARRVRATLPLEEAVERLRAGGPPAPDRIHPLRSRLERALADLTEIQREVVLLHDLDGWKHRDLAAVLGISEVMARQHLFQARRRLRRLLGAGREE